MVKRKQQDRARLKNIVQGSRSLLKRMGMKETQFEFGEQRFERVSKTKRKKSWEFKKNSSSATLLSLLITQTIYTHRL